ncbi:uridine diphosphate glucose pyrophosphatase NUDT22 isoform X3 [Silurus meridionalis]|uniref:uridine diphosphate glucose pyrophosphatase NUDT22 isoform X3 n=1 Tax=Silurus meridionalis TaxID=175797 RepID=UPI001EEB6FDC|nr:uridine diphosphate glucose pyrophosphatase NUDT22 isoform X3 [Silurus meridionalis]
MDHEVSVMLHCAPAQGFEEHQVEAEISSRFNRSSVPEIEEHIEAVWNERVTKEPWLFNGAKFRLHLAELSTKPPQAHTHFCTTAEAPASQTVHCETAEIYDKPGNYPARNHITLHCVGEGEHASQREMHGLSVNAIIEKSSSCREGEGEPEDEGTSAVMVRLQLGLTCYKDFLGTNWSQEAVNLQKRGQLELGDPQALLAQPLGVGAVLLTSDEQVVMLRRSQRVAEAAGLLDIPGGHPEPKVNVPLDFLSAPVLMGIALNHTSAGRPSAEFFIRCSLTEEEVKEFYWRGGPEAHESTDIVFLSKSEMLQLDVKSPLWSELCPSAKGAVLLYQLASPSPSGAGGAG